MTSNSKELIALAERCEAAAGPDRELDALIGQAIGAEPFAICDTGNVPIFASFTASLDAAMTLVPEGWFLSMKQTSTYERRTFAAEDDSPLPNWTAQLIPEGPNPDKLAWRDRSNGEGATSALALCAAALKARATQSVSEDDTHER